MFFRVSLKTVVMSWEVRMVLVKATARRMGCFSFSGRGVSSGLRKFFARPFQQPMIFALSFSLRSPLSRAMAAAAVFSSTPSTRTL